MRARSRQDEGDRFAEALSPRLMGPRLTAALGTHGPTHVLDAKFERLAKDDKFIIYDLRPKDRS